ncbi:MAG: hypothetical protein ACK4V6_07295 [Microthrixaceae bacterium]
MTLHPALWFAEVEVMLTTSDIPGEDPTVLTTAALDTFDALGSSSRMTLAMTEPTPSDPLAITPKGPTGLLRALITATAPADADRALPTTDAAGIGLVVTPFDYDPALALDLDGEPLDG